MDNIFTVTKAHLERFSAEEAVSFFRELLWAEATSIGLSKNLIKVPSAITVSDGGIDAEIKDVIVATGQGIIKPGNTRYQIKTGNFSLNNDANVKNILFREGSSELKPRVKTCLDNGGTLIVVLFGWDKPEKQDDQFINRFRKKLCTIDSKYANSKIETWLPNQIIGFLKRFPSLCLLANGRSGSIFQTHNSWATDAEMQRGFTQGESQRIFIQNIQDTLRPSIDIDESIHVRVYGDPGIGKTRLILEATRHDDLLPLVVYCSSASQFKYSILMDEILRGDNQFCIILVVDECNRDDSAYIWDKLKLRRSRIKLVTIYNEFDDTSGNISYFDTPPLEEEQISSIIQQYAVPKESANKWSELCSGSPRVAHVIGWNLANNPEDILKPVDTGNIWERYIIGTARPDSQLVLQRWTVLRYIALFKRFGNGSSFINEAKAISNLINKADPQITWNKFQEIIKGLKTRKILQGEDTLYVTPKALHIYLWIDWWNNYGNGFQFDEFSKDFPDQLRDWFYEMFKYAAESEPASSIAKSLLGKGGPFYNDTFLKTKLGGNFFLALSEAEPATALQCLKETVGTWNKENLLNYTTGRRAIIWALEKLAVHKHLFADSARLLLSLAEAENETWTNNASGVFAGLFTPAPGVVSPSEASPEERFPILKEALESPSKAKRLLALNAANAALKSGHFSRISEIEYQGLKELKLWKPRTYGELFDAYRRVWQYLFAKLDDLESDEQQKSIHILLDHARSLSRISNLFEMVIDTLKNMSHKPYVKKEDLISTVENILHYERKNLSPEKLQQWQEFADDLIGNDYFSLLKRFVALDLTEDFYDEEGKRIDKAQAKITELAQFSISNIDQLKSNLEWLSIAETQNSFRFGYELGMIDNTYSLLPVLLASQKNTGKSNNITFLGGYFRALSEKAPVKWENQLDKMLTDADLRQLIPELTWRSNLTDRATARIIELIKELPSALFQLRMLSGKIHSVSEEMFTALLEFLLCQKEPFSISVALELFDAYYTHDKSRTIIPEGISYNLLTYNMTFNGDKRGIYDPMFEFHWSIIARRFIKEYPKRRLDIARQMLEHFGEEAIVVTDHDSRAIGVLDEITKENPKEVWDLIIKYVGPPIDSRSYNITRWLRGQDWFSEGGDGALQMIPQDSVWEWVDEDLEKRAHYLATFVPNKLFREENKVCFAREILCRYGDRDDVRHGLMANCSTEGWSGSASLHYQTKKQELLEFRAAEQNTNVFKWIDEYTDALDHQIKQEKIAEERED